MKRTYNINVIHCFADGRVMTHEEFFAAPVVIKAENNYELFCEANKVLDPNYFEKERMRRKYQRAQERKAELLTQQAKIAKQLQDIDAPV